MSFLEQDELDAPQGLRGRSCATGGKLPRLHKRLLEECWWDHRAFQFPRHHRPNGNE